MARRRSGKKIDFLHWTFKNFTFAAVAAGTGAGTMLAAQHLPETLMRTRGNLDSYVDGNQAPGVSAFIGVGMILVPEGTGSTVLWSPLTDPDAPWFWFESFSLGYEEYVTDVIDCPNTTGFRAVIDSKAMRIVKNMEVQAVVENVTSIGALSANIHISARFLAGT